MMHFDRPDTTDPQTIGAAALRYVLEHGHAAALSDSDLRHAAAAAIVARMPRHLHPTALDALNRAADWIIKTQIRRAQQLDKLAAQAAAMDADADSPAPGDPDAPQDAPAETDAELCLRALQAVLRIAGRPGPDNNGGGSRVPAAPRPLAPAPSTHAPTPPAAAPQAPARPAAPTAKPAPFDF